MKGWLLFCQEKEWLMEQTIDLLYTVYNKSMEQTDTVSPRETSATDRVKASSAAAALTSTGRLVTLTLRYTLSFLLVDSVVLSYINGHTDDQPENRTYFISNY